MGLFDGLLGGGSSSNKYTEQRDNANRQQEAYAGDMGQMGRYDEGTYMQYRPQQIANETNYIGQQKQIADNGLDANTRAMLLGSYANGPGYQADQANSAQDMSDFERGISPGASTSEGARVANNNTALGAYQQAMAQLGLTNYNAKIQARGNELNGYNNIVAPAQSGANNELSTAANVEGNVGNAYDRSGQELQQWQDAHSPGAALGKLAGVAMQAYGMGAFGGAPAKNMWGGLLKSSAPSVPAGGGYNGYGSPAPGAYGGGGGVWQPGYNGGYPGGGSGDVGTSDYGTVPGVKDLG